MRFIGNKANILDYIHSALASEGALRGDRFFDFFAGTASVGKYFRAKNYRVASSDILYFSYVLQRAYIEADEQASFEGVAPLIVPHHGVASGYGAVLNYLNALEGVDGFIFQNYTDEGTLAYGSEHIRKYFKPENGRKIDAIRMKLEEWRGQKCLTDHEYFILLATLVESVPFYANISGVYAAFLKGYDPRATKDFVLRPIEITPGKPGIARLGDSMTMLDTLDTDILYLDPPYNARQYAPNYHLLETIARYDNPVIRGVSGMRSYDNQKSDFCNVVTALKSLENIVQQASYTTLALSYNSEGIMPQEAILAILARAGKTKLVEFQYRRFRSNSNGSSRNTPYVSEQLYVLQRQPARAATVSRSLAPKPRLAPSVG